MLFLLPTFSHFRLELALETEETLDIQRFSVNTGQRLSAISPAMMLSLLIYCYATGRFSARTIADS